MRHGTLTAMSRNGVIAAAPSSSSPAATKDAFKQAIVDHLTLYIPDTKYRNKQLEILEGLFNNHWPATLSNKDPWVECEIPNLSFVWSF